VGTGVARSITGLGFQPDLVWIKNRNDAWSHNLFDTLRPNSGGFEYFYTDTSGSSVDSGTAKVTTMDSDGFSLGTNGNVNGLYNYIAWGWKAGGAPSGDLKTKIYNGTTTTESDFTSGNGSHGVVAGSAWAEIKQSVNQEGGFSITKFKIGSGASGDYAWFKHNLSTATDDDPDFIILKNVGATQGWWVWHKTMNSGTWHANNNLWLDSDAYLHTNGGRIWRSGATTGMPTGDGKIHIDRNYSYAASSTTDEFICYAWKAVSGVSAFGTYTGNGGGGAGDNLITGVGFSPRYMMIKRTSGGAGSWMIYDTFRSGAGEIDDYLYANGLATEATTAAYGVTPTADGFTLDSGTTTGSVNADTATYIYAAFA
jgi:hypothetical protein